MAKISAKKGNPELLILTWKTDPVGYSSRIPP